MEKPLARRAALALQGIGEGLERYMNEHFGKALSTGSAAMKDRIALDEGGPSDQATLAAAVSFVTLGVASDHLRSAYRLMVDNDQQVSVNRYGIYSVLRVALEVGALAWWVVDPTTKAKGRLTRALTVMENSRNRRRVIEEAASRSGDTDYLDSIRQVVEAQSRTHHLQKITSRIDAGQEVRLPDAVDLIRLQFNEVSLGAEDDVVAIYGMMSEMMHGNLLGTMAGFVPRTPNDLVGPLVPAVSIPHLVSAAHVSGHGVATAMLDFIGYMGWDLDKWSEIAQPHLNELEETLGSAKKLRPSAFRGE